MQVRINQQDFTYDVQGEAGLTDGRVLLAADDDLTANTPWAAEGYTVADFLLPTEQAALRNGLTPVEIKEVLMQAAVYCGVPAANSAFKVAQQVIREETTPTE